MFSPTESLDFKKIRFSKLLRAIFVLPSFFFFFNVCTSIIPRKKNIKNPTPKGTKNSQHLQRMKAKDQKPVTTLRF